MTKKEKLHELAENFCDELIYQGNRAYVISKIKKFIDYMLQSEEEMDIADTAVNSSESKVENSETEREKMFNPFFFEYFLYHGYLAEAEENTIREAVFDFHEKHKIDFHSMLSYELQKKLNEYYKGTTYSRDVYMALHAFIGYWKNKLLEIERLDCQISYSYYKNLVYPCSTILSEKSNAPYWGDVYKCNCNSYPVSSLKTSVEDGETL